MLCIAYKKVVVVKLKFKFCNVPNLVTLVQILWNFSWDVLVFKQRTCQSAQNAQLFTTTSTYDIMSARQNSWFSNFIWILYNFKTFLRHYLHHDQRRKCLNLVSFRVHGLRDVSWTLISFFQQLYSMISCTCCSYQTSSKKYLERSKIFKYSKQS
jgi:hypothetical protein